MATTPTLILGELVFPVSSGLRGLEISEGNTQAEHARIDRQPAIQQLGRKLETLSLSILLHYLQPQFSEGSTVAERLFALRAAKDSGQLLTLQHGSGFADGKYAIESMSTKFLQTRPDGDPLAAEIDLELKGSTTPDEIEIEQARNTAYRSLIAGFTSGDLTIPTLP